MKKIQFIIKNQHISFKYTNNLNLIEIINVTKINFNFCMVIKFASNFNFINFKYCAQSKTSPEIKLKAPLKSFNSLSVIKFNQA